MKPAFLFCFCVVSSFHFLQVKLEPRSPAKPSRVVHIRNIPNDVTEAEIVHLGIPFGRVTNVLVLKGKNQVRFFFLLFFQFFCPLRSHIFLEVVCGLARPDVSSRRSLWAWWSHPFLDVISY